MTTLTYTALSLLAFLLLVSFLNEEDEGVDWDSEDMKRWRE